MITLASTNTPLTDEVCRTARLARDARFDGLFFSGASTTKIYCRPTCPGKPPLASNSVYFRTGPQAEAAGYRPCLRCRAEAAPGNLIRNAQAWTVRRALECIHQWRPARQSSKALAARIEASAHGLGASFHEALGASPQTYIQTFRSGFAKTLLTDTALPLQDVALAAGFADTQRLLDALTRLCGRDLLKLRKPLPVTQAEGLQSCALRLAYRPPFGWPALLAYFRARVVRGVECVDERTYRRSFCLDGHAGWLSITDETDANAVRLEVHISGVGSLMPVVFRVRRMLDLDADPMVLASFFGPDHLLGPALARHPGLRVPVCWDAFEFAVRAIAGQLISVNAATAAMGRIAASFGRQLKMPAADGIERLFPGPLMLKGVDLRSCGLTRTKAAAVNDLAQEAISGRLDLTAAADLEAFIKKCTAIRGIGDWTAQTIAMRGLGDPDAFPASDLGIVKALSGSGKRLQPKQIYDIAERWRPRRAYAAMLLWMM